MLLKQQLLLHSHLQECKHTVVLDLEIQIQLNNYLTPQTCPEPYAST